MTELATTTARPVAGPRRPAGQSSGPRRNRGPGSWIVFAALVALLVVFLFPFILAAANAIKTPADYAAHGAIGVPQSFSFDALVKFWQNVDFTRKLINSIVLSGCVAVFGTLLSMLNAYAIGIGRIRGGGALLVLLLIGLMIPQEALVYPLYLMAKATHLFDSLLSCIIVFSILQSTFGTYLLSSVLSAFPTEIIEAAKVDGANSWQVLWYIVVPVLRPTLAVLGTFFFIWTWNEFLLPLVLLVSNDNQTVSVAMGVLNGQYVSDPTSTAAAALLGMAPTVIFFLIFQRTLTRGVTVGAIK